MKKVISLLICFLLLTQPVFAAVTKSTAAVDEWAAIAMNTIREGTTVDVSDCYAATLHISMAQTSETAHTGAKIEVQVSGNTSGDEDWTTLTAFIGPTGTANSEAITNNPLAAGSVTATCTSTTGLYDDDETRWIFILNGTVANSEMCLLVSHSANASVTWQDGTTNAHALNTLMYDIAKNYVVELPTTANRVRVIYDNTYDVDGSQVHTYCRITKITGI